MSDQAIATRIEAFAEPNLEKVCQDISPDLTPVADYKPYDLSAPDGIAPRVAPGTRIHERQISCRHRPGARRIGPSDRLAEIAHADDRQAPQKIAGARRDPARCRKFTARRKETSCSSAGARPKVPIKEAVDRARAAGDSVSSIHLRHINPLPNGLENIFSGFNHVLVVEMNDEGIYGYGQLAALLRARYCDPNIRGINKTDGLTWKVKEILERAKAESSPPNGNAQTSNLQFNDQINHS